MYKFFKTLAFIALIFTFACSDENNSSQKAESSFSLVRVFAKNSNEPRHAFNVELANTSEKIYHGLMGRSSLDENGGMLFDLNLVPKDVDIAFWMKDTLIPLDILFIDDNGIIFFIHKNARPYDTSPIYPPKRPRAVLEIRGGQADIHNINVGDKLKADLLGN